MTMKRIGMALAMAALVAASAHAQTMTGTKSNISARAKLATDIPLNAPRAVDLGGLEVPGAGTDMTEGVTVKGFTRYVEFEGKKIGQVVFAGVEKNGRVEPLPPESFAGQFDLKKTQLDPASPVTVQGDAAALLAALKRLNEKPPVVGTAAQTPEPPKSNRDVQQAGGQAPQNQQAAQYRTPEPLQIQADVPEAIRVTASGCPVRIDLAQLKAVQQSRTETTKGAAVVSEGDCTDSGESFPLLRSYSLCSDEVDVAAKTATARYSLYYTDAGGARQEVADCQPDTDKVFPITENFSSCSVSLDYANMKAVPQSNLTYRNSNNVEVQVRGCEPSATKAPVALVKNTAGCTIRHDFAAGKSIQQESFSYLMDAINYQAGSCADSATEYPHTKEVKDASGAFVCAPVVNMAGKTVTVRSRISITVGGVGQYITECTPEPGGPISLTATTEGCENPADWTHDVSAGISYATERFYYTYNGDREYANTCQQSAVTFAHQLENTGWQNEDGQKGAYPRNTVFINAPTGRYNVRVSEVLPGALLQPYVVDGTTTRQTANITYEGCNKYVGTENIQKWKRPDNTIFEEVTGPGTPNGPTNACALDVTWSTSPSTTFTSGPYGDYSQWCDAMAYSQYNWNCSYAGTNKKTREDGVVVATQTGNCSTSYSSCGANNGYNNPGHCVTGDCPTGSCPATIAASAANNCQSAWGWW